MAERLQGGFYDRYGKRVLDLVLTVPAIVVLSPVLAVVAILVRLNLGTPVLFCQQRPGLGTRAFTAFQIPYHDRCARC